MKIKNMLQQLQMFRIKTLIGVLITILIIGSNPLLATTSKGPKIKLIMKDGAQLQGKLQNISDRTLTLFDKNTEKEFKVNIDEMNELIIVKKSKVGIGCLIGLGVGALGGYVLSSRDQIARMYRPAGSVYLGVFGAGVGALTGLLTGSKSKHYKIQKMNDSTIEALLLLLKDSLGPQKETSPSSSPNNMKESNIKALASILESSPEQKVKLSLPKASFNKSGFSLGLSLLIH
jgi:hypothetical protein